MATPKSPKTTPRSPKAAPRNVKVDRRKALLVAKKKKECNAKAQNIVEEFIDGATDQVYFLAQLRWINQTHYQDIIEERAIIKICGYPLCCQKLVNIPKQKYHISSSQNRVYDITERKNFCSNQCYKASSYLKNQLYTSPLWVRDIEPVPSFTLFHSSMEFNVDDVNFALKSIHISKDSNENETDSDESSPIEKPFDEHEDL